MRAPKWLWLAGLAVLSGCMALGSAATPEEPASSPTPQPATAVVSPETGPMTVPNSEAGPTAPPGATAIPEPTPAPELLPEEPAPPGGEREFSTDFSRHTVPYGEIISGGPPKDGIPAVDAPQAVVVPAADAWLEDVEPVILVEIGDAARAYPLQILTWHEIVNDTLGGVPVAVTFCPLCNTAIAYDRRFPDGEETLVLDFGTTGRLRYSNLIMYDRQTETWWQQATGDGLAGRFAGRRLAAVPASIIAWADFKTGFPEGTVLSRDTGRSRAYGQNPYAGYDDVNSAPFLYQGPETPGELPAMARVLTVEMNGEAVAFPYTTLAELGVANDEVGGQPLVAIWQPGVASALDREIIADSRDVGTVVAYSRELDGEVLTFRVDDGRILDDNTGTAWDLLGRGVDGPLAGRRLEAVAGINAFWFSWAAFRPETRIYTPAAEPQGDVAPTPTTEVVPADGVTLQLAEDFEVVVYTGAETLGGERVMLSELFAESRPVVVEFWAGACPVCRRALPDTQASYLEYRDEVVFIGVDIGLYTGLGDEAAARALYTELGLSFPTGTILDPEPLQAYRVTGIPTTLYFTPDGALFDRGGGIVGLDRLRQKLDALLAASQ